MKVVSVIIPVFNNDEGLTRCLGAIKKQRMDTGKYEIIVIDNGSEVPPREISRSYGATFLEEIKYLNSPYSARNRGLEVAKGEIIVLLDTTCAPVPEWLEKGIELIEQGNGLVAGNVTFDVTESSTISELYDSLTNIRMKESVTKRGVAKTTNLFIRKDIFNQIGFFPEGLRSGGDVRWTYQAVVNGNKLVFSESAEAIMLPRRFRDLLKKQFRVAKGMPAIWKEQKTFRGNFLKQGLLCFVPHRPSSIRKLIDSNGKPFMHKKFYRLYILGYFLKLVHGCGVLWGFCSALITKRS